MTDRCYLVSCLGVTVARPLPWTWGHPCPAPPEPAPADPLTGPLPPILAAARAAILEAEPDRYDGLTASAIRTRLGIDMQRALKGRSLDPIPR